MIDKLKSTWGGLKKEVKLAILILCGLLVFTLVISMFSDAEASCYSCQPEVNNYSVTNGVSDSDLAAGIAMGMAGGGHKFDFSTQDNQASVIYARQFNEEDKYAYSFGYARRWDELGKALFHVSFTPSQEGNGDYGLVGATFRF